MKKLNLLLLSVMLVGCKSNNNGYKDFRIIVPTGAPAIAMSAFCDFLNFETVTDPSKILPVMATGQVDIAVLPTNVGITAIHDKSIPYKLLGTITFGNFYIASTGNDEDGVVDANDYIVSFQKGAVPDKIFHYVHENSLDNALHYVSSAQEAAKCLKLGKNLTDDSRKVDYVVIAEPALTSVMQTSPNVFVYEDLQESYKLKSGGLGIYQASVFVNKTIDKKIINENIEVDLKMSITEMLTSENAVLNYMNKVSNPELLFGVNPEVAQQITIIGNKLGLGYERAEKNIDGINLFLSLFGVGELKNEDIA